MAPLDSSGVERYLCMYNICVLFKSCEDLPTGQHTHVMVIIHNFDPMGGFPLYMFVLYAFCYFKMNFNNE